MNSPPQPSRRNFSEEGSGEESNAGGDRRSGDSNAWRKGPPRPRRFLIVEDNSEGQFLLARTLKRKFADAHVQSCEAIDAALAAVQQEKFDAIVVHRTGEAEGVTVTRELRAIVPEAVIVMVSGRDRSPEAAAAGATRFLNYEEWLRIGTVVAAELEHGGG